MRRKAIQLSLNFLIITIISLVVFSMGIYLINRFFGEAEGTVLIWEKRIEEEIEDLLDSGDRVAIPFDHKYIGNKKFDSFGVGILNIIDKPRTNFRTYVNFSKAYQGSKPLCTSSTQGNCGNPDSWLRSTKQSIGPLLIEKTIKKYDHEKFLIGVQVKNAPKGTYIFDVNVTYQNETGYWVDYDNLRKFMVDVKH